MLVLYFLYARRKKITQLYHEFLFLLLAFLVIRWVGKAKEYFARLQKKESKDSDVGQFPL